jgi:hypothetical protein
MTTRGSMQPLRADMTSARRVRDPYADLLRDTRGIKREHAAARDAWFAGLAFEGKEDTLFELEMLLKGVVAWGDARNHPIARDRVPLRQRDFVSHLAASWAALRRALALVARLDTVHRRSPLLRSLLPSAEAPCVELTGETPEQALCRLDRGLRSVVTVFEGLSRGGHVSYRTFLAATLLVQREVAYNPCFNPLFTLEFRPEFDRVRVPEVLDAILSVENEAAHRFVALACLGTLRLLRLAGLMRATCKETDGVQRVWPLAAALRADARALAVALQHRAAPLLAETLERDLMRLPAAEMRANFDVVARECDRLRRLQAVLTSMAMALRAESRRLVQASLPPCEAGVSSEGAAAAALAAERFAEALQALLVRLLRVLRGGVDAEHVFGDRSARVKVAARLREDVWMFHVITRAFLWQAAATTGGDTWRDGPDLAFARDYLEYFRSMGFAVALETEYPHSHRLAVLLMALRDADWVDKRHLSHIVMEVEQFAAHLRRVLEVLGQGEELRGVPFDRVHATETLRMHLHRVGTPGG